MGGLNIDIHNEVYKDFPGISQTKAESFSA